MRTSVTFRGFEGIEHLKAFVVNTTRSAVNKYQGGLISDTYLVLSTRPAEASGHQEYECEALIRGPEFETPVVVRKRHTDFYLAVRQCMKAVDKILKHNAKISENRRRRAYHANLHVVHA